MALRVVFRTICEITQTSEVAADIGVGTPMHPIRLVAERTFTSGTGSNQADKVYCKRRQVTAGSPVDLDILGSLIDGLGGSFTGVEVRAIMIVNRSTTGTLLVGGDSAAAYAGLFAAANDVIKVGPGVTVDTGGYLLWVAPVDSKGLIPTASTADSLQIDADSGTVEFDIVLLAVSV